MRTLQQMPRDQIMLMILLVGLLLLGVFLLLNDPNLKHPGNSRVDWPPATPAKP